jgi:hypothetical protein
VHRVIVAMPDRRGTIPVQQLLSLRLNGVKIEEATSWLEKMSGRIEVEQLYPSWLIFAEGFRFSNGLMVLRRVFSIVASALLLLIVSPIIPFVILAIKLDSPGPILYRQKRVGLGGNTFFCFKFRTMRQDAEADTGATWATDDDPRITRVGRFLRSSRLDEIPQLRSAPNSSSGSPKRFRTTLCAMLYVQESLVGLKSVTSMATRWKTPKRSCNTTSSTSRMLPLV